MSWAGALPRTAINEYLGETYDFDAREHGAYQLLMMRYVLAGPLPSDNKRLASIARVTKHVWTKRIWPVFQEFFTPGDDGLIHHEALDQIAAEGGSNRSAAGRKASNARWARVREQREFALLAIVPNASDRMPNASDRMANASESHMRFASDASRAPSLSLKDSEDSKGIESKRESLRERESARAGVDAPLYASGDAIASDRMANASDATMQSHTGFSTISTRPLKKIADSPAATPADWQPSAEGGSGEAIGSASHASGMPNASDATMQSHTGFSTISTRPLKKIADSPAATPADWQPSAEGGSGEAIGSASHASGMPNASDATMQSHTGFSTISTRPLKKIADSPTIIPADWQPSDEGAQFSRSMGYDPARLRDVFVDTYRAKGSLKLDWQAQFRIFVRYQPAHDAKHQQTSIKLPIEGGGAAAAAGKPAASASVRQFSAAEVGRLESWLAGQPDLARQWASVRGRLRQSLGDVEYTTWFAGAALLSVGEDEVVLGFPSRFLCDWARQRRSGDILKLWQAEIPELRRVEFVEAPAAGASKPPAGERRDTG